MGRKFVKEATDLPDRSKNLYWVPENGDNRLLNLHEQKVYATLGTGVTCTLTLPNVVEAEGLTFSIYAVDGTGSCTVTTLGARDWSDLTVDATNDAVILRAQGGKYWPIDNEIS